MASKYLSRLSEQEYNELTEKLCAIQNNQCFICGQNIDLNLHTTNIDHIVPLANRGKDSDENFALTHESCNKSKQDANLNIARILHKLKNLQETSLEKNGKAASLKDVLLSFGGSKFDFKYNENGESLEYCFDQLGSNDIQQTKIFNDKLSKERTCFL